MNTQIKKLRTIFNILFLLVMCPYFMGAMNVTAGDVTHELKKLTLAAPEDHKKATQTQYPEMLKDYVATLPKISDCDHTSLPEQIVKFLCNFSSTTVYSGEDVLVSKVKAYIEEKQPIKLLIVAFAVKSSNPGKVLEPGTLDFAEYVGLFTLNYMCEQIQSVYEPGAQLVLFSREEQIESANIITQDAFGLDIFPRKLRDLYQQQLQELIHDAGFRSLHLLNPAKISEIYAQEEQRELAMKKDLKDVDQQVLKGLQAFWREDLDCPTFIQAAEHKNKKQHRKLLNGIADTIAFRLLLGSLATRRVVQKCVPDYDSYIRLSVRADENGDVSSKLGINLIYGSAGSPSHGLIVVKPKSVTITTVKEVEKQQEERGHQYINKTYKVGDLKLVYKEWVGIDPEFFTGGGLY